MPASDLPSLDILIGKSKGPGGKPLPGPPTEATDDENMFEQDDSGADEMLVGAAKDVMSALRARDDEGFAIALKDFVSMC